MDDPQLNSKEIIVIIIIISFVVVAIVGCVLACVCRAVPDVKNRVFRLKRVNDPCVKCQLIEMGEMACYTGICPGCGRVPPSIAANM